MSDVEEARGPLLDEQALERYLSDKLGPPSRFSVVRHNAGHSNETFFIDHGDRQLVLRRPPAGAFLPTAHDVGREYKVLAALGSTDVRVPRVLLSCSDTTVIGAKFYVMERVDGEVIRDELPTSLAGSSDRARIGIELVDALVELHSVDSSACGLGDFGRPTGYLERQLKRWSGQLELTVPHTRPLPQLEEVADWLARNKPESQASTIVHGDYKLDNVVFFAAPPARLAAILDWEMSTLGDPLADLGWMISFWQQDESEDSLRALSNVTSLEGFSRVQDLVVRYQELTGIDASGIDWYVVFAIYKLAVLLEGSYARHLAGVTDDPFFADLETGVPALASRAKMLIRNGGKASALSRD